MIHNLVQYFGITTKETGRVVDVERDDAPVHGDARQQALPQAEGQVGEVELLLHHELEVPHHLAQTAWA